jgi:peptidyl-prolyl cis-trans isomerase D
VLHAFYDAHAALFTSPSRVSFEQLFFSADRGGWEEAALRARRAREQLIRESPSAAPADDAFPLEIPAGALSRTDAGRIFGETAIVDALFSAPQGRWSEPVRSAYGWHLIKPAHREASSIASYATVRPQVEAVYLQQQAQVSERHELDTLRARYEIIRQDKRGPGL